MGSLAGHRLDRYGHMRLRSLLAKETVSPEITRQSALACQFSSVGSLNNAWIKEFSQSLMSCADDAKVRLPTASPSASLDHPLASLSERQKQTSSSCGPPSRSCGTPSMATVPGVPQSIPHMSLVCRRSAHRPPGLRIALLRREQPEGIHGSAVPQVRAHAGGARSRNAPHQVLHAPSRGPPGLVRPRRPGDDCAAAPPPLTAHRGGCRLCLTSANLSKAAWGALQKDNTQLMIRNFEIGVLFLPSRFDHCKFLAATAPARLSSGTPQLLLFIATFAHQRWRTDTVLMPLPYRLEPLDRYSASDAPWVWDRPYPEPDTHGVTWGV